MKKNTPQPPKPVQVQSLDDLDRMCRKPFDVLIPAADGMVTIQCHRLRPAESAKVSEILEDAIPPTKVVNGDEVFDLSDPGYVRRKAEAERSARALACYFACPLFPRMEGASSMDIVAVVQSKLTETVLAMIYQVVRDQDRQLGEALRFFSDAGSPPS